MLLKGNLHKSSYSAFRAVRKRLYTASRGATRIKSRSSEKLRCCCVWASRQCLLLQFIYCIPSLSLAPPYRECVQPAAESECTYVYMCRDFLGVQCSFISFWSWSPSKRDAPPLSNEKQLQTHRERARATQGKKKKQAFICKSFHFSLRISHHPYTHYALAVCMLQLFLYRVFGALEQRLLLSVSQSTRLSILKIVTSTCALYAAQSHMSLLAVVLICRRHIERW